MFSFCVDVVVVAVVVDNKVCLEGANTVWYGGFMVLFVFKVFIINGPVKGCECGHSLLLLLYVSVAMLMLVLLVLSLVLMVLFTLLLLFITWRTGVGLMFVVVSL